MKEVAYERLEDVIQDELFPEVDLALRYGRHIGIDDPGLFAFLKDTQEHLERFYRRYGCELVRVEDGYFYLMPSGDHLGRRHLGAPEMLVGQALALLYLEPETSKATGVITRGQLLETLAGLVGEENLIVALNPRRRRRDERISQETVRKELDKAVRSLASLGFVEMMEDECLRLRLPVLRFADPVRGLEDRAGALRRLAMKGAVSLGEPANSDDEEGA